MNFIQFAGAIETGLIYGLVAAGVYISFRILDFPDLTADGSFTLGAAVSGTLILSNYDPWVAVIAAIICGALAGLFTAWLNIRWKITHLLASILTMTALYSINLRIMGKPNLAIMEEETVFIDENGPIHEFIYMLMGPNYSKTVLLIAIAGILIGLLTWFFASEFGLAVRATGKSPRMVIAQGVKIGAMTLMGIAISNGIIAFGGALFAQSAGYADITMGTGTIIAGLAAIIIGESIMPTRSILVALISCIIGSIAFRMVLAAALNGDYFGLQSQDQQMVQAGLVALVMILTHARSPIKNYFNRRRRGAQ